MYEISSHWEKRTLHHEVMNGYISRYAIVSCHFTSGIYFNMASDYMVMSEFTLALFEDSGWYRGNYTALNNLKQNPLQWGKGKHLNLLILSPINYVCYNRLGV